jgi:NifU-like protein involved in Fe-S cluster formation
VARLPPALDAEFRVPWRGAGAPVAEASGEAVNAVCGDWVRLELDARRPEAVGMRLSVRGCSATIAVASLVARSADGQTLEHVRALDVAALVEQSGGLAPVQRHAVAVVERALAGALALASKI